MSRAGSSSSVHQGCTAVEQFFVTPWIARVNTSHFSVWFSLRPPPQLTCPTSPAGYLLLLCVSHRDLLGEFLAAVKRGQSHLQSWNLQSWFAAQQCQWEHSLGWCLVTKGQRWSQPVPVCAHLPELPFPKELLTELVELLLDWQLGYFIVKVYPTGHPFIIIWGNQLCQQYILCWLLKLYAHEILKLNHLTCFHTFQLNMFPRKAPYILDSHLSISHSNMNWNAFFHLFKGKVFFVSIFWGSSF